MMNITLLAAQAALADTLAGGNPVLTPVFGGGSDESLGYGGERWMDHACAGSAVRCRVFISSLNVLAVHSQGREGRSFVYGTYPGLYSYRRGEIGYQLLPYYQYSFCPYD